VRRGQSGAPLATTNGAPAEVSCKRRDAVRLGRIEAARPPGAGSGVLSGATVSWAAPRQFVPLTLLFLWAHCRRRHVHSRVAEHVAEPQSRSRRGCILPVGRMLSRKSWSLAALYVQISAEAGTHGILSGTASRPLTMLMPKAAVPGERTVSRAPNVPKLCGTTVLCCRCTARTADRTISPRAEG
jgi:hypothetical protein